MGRVKIRMNIFLRFAARPEADGSFRDGSNAGVGGELCWGDAELRPKMNPLQTHAL
jgi:hypothetical protein